MVVFTLVLATSVILGAMAGVIWAVAAPRVLFQSLGSGAAQQVNAEATGYIAADGWFCLITALCGLIGGLLGHYLLVRRDGWPAAAVLICSALGGALVTMWIGGLIGLNTYNHQLATSASGIFFNSSLSLGAKSALAIWPLVTAGVLLIGNAGGRDRTAVPGSDAFPSA